jgi:hypothetical protein
MKRRDFIRITYIGCKMVVGILLVVGRSVFLANCR